MRGTYRRPSRTWLAIIAPSTLWMRKKEPMEDVPTDPAVPTSAHLHIKRGNMVLGCLRLSIGKVCVYSRGLPMGQLHDLVNRGQEGACSCGQ